MKNTINLFLQSKKYSKLFKANEKLLQKVITEISKEIKLDNLVVSLNIVNSKRMHEVNKEFRNKNKTTDVLSFPMFEKSEDKFDLGDIFINFDLVKDYKHFVFLFVHSCLHLIGYTHDKRKEHQKMEKREQEIMSYIM